MTRELRISIFDFDGRRLFDWRIPRERRTPIFGAAVRPGDISRALFRLRNEDVGPIADLLIRGDSRFVASISPRRIESLPVDGEVPLAIDFTLPSDYALVRPGKTTVFFSGTVTGWV